MRQWVLIAAACGASGCYSYLPLDTRPVPGAEVTIDLTSTGSDSLARLLGPGVTQIRGRTVAAGEGGLELTVAATAVARGDETYWKGEEVTIPWPMVTRARTRKLSMGRSVLLGGAIVGASLGAVAAFGNQGKAEGTPSGGTPQVPQ